MNLEKLRAKIDRLDARLVELLNQRADVVLKIGQHKQAEGMSAYVPSREKKVLENVRSLNQGPMPDEALWAIYREIMSASIALEQPLRVAYLGPPTTFTHQAAHKRFGSALEYLPCDTITDVFSAVQARQADYGVAPVENSIEGAVNHTLDELPGSSLKICAEIYLRIAHYLMAAQTELSKIKKVYSKDQVFGQCRNWLHNNLPGVELEPVASTARAAEMATKEQNVGALASLLAAETYGLHVLARNIQDSSANTTRFLVLGKDSAAPTGNDKTSLVFSTKHHAGALHRVLAVFKKHSVNMTKIESRPNRQKAWEYLFFVDIEGHAQEKNVQVALSNLEKYCTQCVLLGSYPRAPETVLA